MSFIDHNANLAGNLMVAGQIAMQQHRQRASDRLTDQTGAAWIRHLTAALSQRDAEITRLRAELSDERSRRLQAHAALRKLLNR